MKITDSLTEKWTWLDYLGTLRVRLGINRNHYRIKPGLYRLGSCNINSPVLVTANYKLTVDILRKAVGNMAAWILILDTKGINVWCAAGKGTFGTEELINRIRKSELTTYVSHRKLILPQLGAPGITPKEVKEKTGFSIIYGPVEAVDLVSFIQSGYKATDEMRRKKYPVTERFNVAVTHFSQGLKAVLVIIILFSFFDLLFLNNSHSVLKFIVLNNSFLAFITLLSGSFLANLLLPYLPGRAFSLKGLILGIPFTLILFLYFHFNFPDQSLFYKSGKLMFLLTFLVFQVLNLTGSSTFTSLSGVRKEMRIVIPVIITTTFISIALLIIGGLIQ